MFKLSLFILLLFPFVLFCQNKTDEKGLKQGLWIKTDAKTGKKIYEGVFKDDKPQGTFKYYYPGMDSLRTLMQFRQNGAIAYATMFHPNGKLQAKGKYSGEQKDSVWTYYDEKAKLLSLETYQQGKKNGKSVIFFPDGSISEEKNYKMDVLEGPFKQYYGDKKVKGEGAYANGTFIGKCSFYFPNGVTVATGVYDKGGIKKGVWIYKTIENKIESREIWVNGKQLNEKQTEEYIKKNKSSSEEKESTTAIKENKKETMPKKEGQGGGKKK